MLKRFAVRNYKNFRDDVCVDFENIAGYQFSTDCITDGTIGKMLIYGRNATGKTNLGRAFMDISSILYGGAVYDNEQMFLNADSTEHAAAFSYEFRFGEQKLLYQYARFPNQELQNEELVINGTVIFRCDFVKNEYDFDHLNYIDAETASRERYLQSLNMDEKLEASAGSGIPFLRWLINNVALKKDSLLIRLSDYVSRMAMTTVGNDIVFRSAKMNFFEMLEDQSALREFEEFLNVMGVACRLELKKLPDGRMELYFAHDRLIPFFENASSGTKALVSFYRRYVLTGRQASFLYLDEFDAFYHYEMAERVIHFLKSRYPMCQIIMTTHNTNLMTNRLMRPDCLFILSQAGNLTALCNATLRELREGHNLEKMYISGEFEKYE